MTSIYFDADEDWLSLPTTSIGAPMTVSFWASWARFNSWSRIIDFGFGQDRENILIANEGGARHFVW